MEWKRVVSLILVVDISKSQEPRTRQTNVQSGGVVKSAVPQGISIG
jgi:hypothetical protein